VEWSLELKFLGKRNRFTPLLKASDPEDASPQLGIWSRALAKVATEPDVLFHVLRNKPILVVDENMPRPSQIEFKYGYAGSSVTVFLIFAMARPSPVKTCLVVWGSYTEAWLRGVGCIPLHNVMEDLAIRKVLTIKSVRCTFD
jgi:hypothetical protein